MQNIAPEFSFILENIVIFLFKLLFMITYNTVNIDKLINKSSLRSSKIFKNIKGSGDQKV